MENYICINGNKTELTEEQLKQLGLEVENKKNNPFIRHPNNKLYWFISAMNVVTGQNDRNDDMDNSLYEVVNYFNDYKVTEQVALHQLLYRKLLKYAYENDAIVDDWSDLNSRKFYLSMDVGKNNKLYVDWNYKLKHGCSVYFNSSKVAEQAIKDVVKPFMEEYPEFVW